MEIDVVRKNSRVKTPTPLRPDTNLFKNVTRLRELSEASKQYTNSKDFFLLACEIENLFQKVRDVNFYRYILDERLHLSLIGSVLQNQLFIDSVKKSFILPRSQQNSHIAIEYKKIIKLCLYVCVFTTARSIRHLRRNDARDLRSHLSDCLKELKDEVAHDLDPSDLYNYLYSVIVDADAKFNYRGVFIRGLDAKLFFITQSVARLVIGCLLHTIQGTSLLSIRFKKANSLVNAEDFDSAIESIKIALQAIRSYHNGFSYFKVKMVEQLDDVSIAERFLNDLLFLNERHIYAILRGFLLEVNPDNGSGDSLLESYIQASPDIRESLAAYAKSNFRAYSGTVRENDKEWANKVYLISYKAACALDAVRPAVDVTWKMGVALFEMRMWVQQMHQIINKYEVEDDWDKIKNFINQENKRVEWKSSFFLSVEGDFISDEIEKISSRQTLQIIVRAMLGMMNTDGGTLIVGLVENPEKIVRDDIRNNLFIKNGVTFFDIQWEMDRLNKKVDDVKQQLVDGLKDMTLLNPVVFNGLWGLEPISVKNDQRAITVYKINIARSDKYLFSAKSEGGSVSISLLRRAEGRTIQDDPRLYFTVNENARQADKVRKVTNG